MKVVKIDEAIDQSLIKESVLTIKQLAIIAGIDINRLYGINNGKVKIRQDEIDKIIYINDRLSELADEMRGW